MCLESRTEHTLQTVPGNVGLNATRVERTAAINV